MRKQTNYVVKRSEGYSDELQHWGFGKKEDHKYIDRKMVNGKWVYTYPEDVAKNKPQFGANRTPVHLQSRAQQQADVNNNARAASAAERQAASIKRTQKVQADRAQVVKERNDRINNAAAEAANRQNEALSGAKRKAIIESNRFKVGKAFGSDLGSVVRNNISKVTGKEDSERKYIRETMGESAARGYDDATNIGKIAKRTATKVKNKADNVVDIVQDKVSDAKSAATKAVKTATEKAAKRRKKVSKAVNNTVKSAKKHVDKGRDWLDGLFD